MNACFCGMQRRNSRYGGDVRAGAHLLPSMARCARPSHLRLPAICSFPYHPIQYALSEMGVNERGVQKKIGHIFVDKRVIFLYDVL